MKPRLHSRVLTKVEPVVLEQCLLIYACVWIAFLHNCIGCPCPPHCSSLCRLALLGNCAPRYANVSLISAAAWLVLSFWAAPCVWPVANSARLDVSPTRLPNSAPLSVPGAATETEASGYKTRLINTSADSQREAFLRPRNGSRSVTPVGIARVKRRPQTPRRVLAHFDAVRRPRAQARQRAQLPPTQPVSPTDR